METNGPSGQSTEKSRGVQGCAGVCVDTDGRVGGWPQGREGCAERCVVALGRVVTSAGTFLLLAPYLSLQALF